ncbi:MAG: hypothetical protein LBR43_00390 [Spiroplasmataceae bacterium]|nr:hypothetical protein [Spiroplasmataceae bacterium]
MTDIRNWLNKEYSKEQRKEIKTLVINQSSKLEEESYFAGELELNDFSNLEELFLLSTKVTKITLTDCPNIKKIICYNNPLEEIELPESANENLEELDLISNFLSGDLSMFRELVNLKKLFIGNNDFWGSLEFLKNLKKLEKLHISNTNIDSGSEYLPDSLRDFYCSKDYHSDCRCKFILEIFTEKRKGITDLDLIEGSDVLGEKINNFSEKLAKHKQKFLKYSQTLLEDNLKMKEENKNLTDSLKRKSDQLEESKNEINSLTKIIKEKNAKLFRFDKIILDIYVNKAKKNLDESLHPYLDIFLEASTSEKSEKIVKKALTGKIDDHIFKQIIYLKEQINSCEYQNQTEVAPVIFCNRSR